MNWEANVIEWLQTSLSGAAGLAKFFDFFGAETGLLILVLVLYLLKYRTVPLSTVLRDGSRFLTDGRI